MVGHDIEQQPHTMAFQFGHQLPEVFFRADFGIQFAVIDDVVSMLAARARHQDRRRIQVRDTEPAKIRNQLARVLEVKAVIQLQPIGRQRDRRVSLRTNSLETGVQRGRFVTPHVRT